MDIGQQKIFAGFLRSMKSGIPASVEASRHGRAGGSSA
jgi:hypothetical protein